MPPAPPATPAPTPAGDQDVTLVLTQAERYAQALTDTIRTLVQRHGAGVVVTANRPVRVLRTALDAASVDRTRLRFVDCISGLTGIVPHPEPDALFIDSPTLLEKTGLRAEQLLRRMDPGHRFLLVDSLSTLAVYNGHAAVTEWAHNLSTRMRLQHAPAHLLLVQGQDTTQLEQAVRPHCDRAENA